MPISRRLFLKSLPLSFLSGIALASIGTTSVGGSVRLSRGFSDHEATARVALSFAQTETFDRHSLDGLVASLEKLASPHKEVWEQLLSSRIQRDFHEGDVVLVDGWVFSRTEANLCVLAAMETQA